MTVNAVSTTTTSEAPIDPVASGSGSGEAKVDDAGYSSKSSSSTSKKGKKHKHGKKGKSAKGSRSGSWLGECFMTRFNTCGEVSSYASRAHHTCTHAHSCLAQTHTRCPAHTHTARA